MTSSDSPLLRAVAAYGLTEASPGLPDAPPDAPTWSALLDAAGRRRVTGHLVQALAHGAFPATEAQWSEALERHEHALGLDLILEQLLLRATGSLDAAGIESRVLKGAAMAHTVYDEPELRSFGDVDLLVPASRYDDALATLCARGGERRYPEPRPGFDRRFGKGVCLEMTDGLEIDVHRTFVAGPFGLAVDTDDLFGAASPFSLGGRVLQALDAESRFLHACYHTALGDLVPRLVAMRDVAQMLLHTSLDGERIRDLCLRWRCGIVVARATRLTWDAFSLTERPALVRWAWRRAPTRFERRALAAYVGPRRSYARQALAGIHALHGIRDKVAYAGALLVPADTYVRTRDGTYLRRLARSAGLLVHDHGTHGGAAAA